MKSILFIGLLTLTITLTKAKGIKHTTIYHKALIDTTKKELRDPVCRMKLNSKSSTTVNYIHEKVSYSFCSEGCKKKFIAKPVQYLKKT